MTVANVAPTVSGLTNQPANEGLSAALTIGSFADPGIDGPWAVTVNWGDSTPSTTFTRASAGSLGSKAHTYIDNGVYTVTVTVAEDGSVTPPSDSKTFQVTVANVAPVVTGSPASQSKQYSDPISDVTISATDVAADTLTPSTRWKIGSAGFTTSPALPSAISLVSGATSNTWKLTGTAQMAPGTYTIRVTISDEDGGSSDQDVTIIVTEEDARATYTGDMFAFTASGGTNATVVLRATIQDITAVTGDPAYDAAAGDIRNATASLTVNGAAPAGCSNLPVALINTDTKTGSVSCDATLDVNAHDIGIIVSGSYTAGSTAAVKIGVVEVAEPNGSFITGGGYEVLSLSKGKYPGGVDSRMNYGFNIKYNKSKTNLQGHANIIFRANGRVYQIKSNAADSLGISFKAGTTACLGPPTSTCWGVADFRAKANLTDVTNPLAPIALGGGLTLQVTVTDKGEPGSADSMGVTLWSGSVLMFSSRWDGAKTVEQVIGGGNLVVH